jgi:mannosyltransferase
MTAAGDLWEQASTASPGAAGGDHPAWHAPARWVMRVPWCWPALLTLALGFYQIGRPELWRDELASWAIAERPLGGMFATTRRMDAAQLAYYLMLHGWIKVFGDSPDAMRGLSVLAMAGAAVCVTLTGQKLAGPRAGLVAGLIFALVPSVSRFAQEIRSYALQVLLATLATLLLLRALDRPLVRRWAAYAAAVAVLGYADLVALTLVTGHLAAVALTWQKNRDRRLFWFVPAAAGAIAVCLPLIIAGSGQAGQVGWIPRPGLDLAAFTSFARNLFYSTSVATALLVLAVVAWVVRWRAAAFATAMTVLPVVAVWAVSQGTHSYFFPRYLLFAVAAWAILAGIAVSRFNTAVAVAVVLMIALLSAGDQEVIRKPGAHNWANYPVGADRGYWDYAGAASVIARTGGGEGIVFPTGDQSWRMIDEGVRYYLEQDGAVVPRQLFVTATGQQAQGLNAVVCKHPAACLGNQERIWIVSAGHPTDVWTGVPPGEAAPLRARYHVVLTRHVEGLSIFLLKRDAPSRSPDAPGRLAGTRCSHKAYERALAVVLPTANPAIAFTLVGARSHAGEPWMRDPATCRSPSTA